MRLIIVSLILLPLFSYAADKNATTNLSYAEFGYSMIDIENSTDDDFLGIGMNFSYRLESDFLLKYERQELENDYELPMNITYHGIGLGYVFDINDQLSTYVIARRKRVSVVDYEDRLDRYYDSKIKSIGGGLSYRISSTFELSGELRVDELEVVSGADDTQDGAKLELAYYPIEGISFVGTWEYVLEQDVFGAFIRFDL